MCLLHFSGESIIQRNANLYACRFIRGSASRIVDGNIIADHGVHYARSGVLLFYYIFVTLHYFHSTRSRASLILRRGKNVRLFVVKRLNISPRDIFMFVLLRYIIFADTSVRYQRRIFTLDLINFNLSRLLKAITRGVLRHRER